MPATKGRLQEYRDAQEQEKLCSQVIRYCQTEWPTKQSIPILVLPFWKVRGSHNQLLLYYHRIVVPKSLQSETIHRLHEGHQGIERCRMMARSSVRWPRISKDLSETVAQCTVCAEHAASRREPLMPTPLPNYPWQVIRSDLFQLNGEHYLIIVDYFSRFPEVFKMTSTVSSKVIDVLKRVFARYGIPEVFRSDTIHF